METAKGLIIQVKDLWKEYEQDGSKKSTALSGTNLKVWQGEIVALFGKSGSGKTTLLNMIAGLDRPTRGTVEVAGKELSLLGDNGLTQLRRRYVGFIFQFFNLLPTLTAFENVFLSLELTGEKDKTKAAEALDSVGLAEKGARYPHELSGGEQQRVAIARALVKEPPVILADEPTGNLDNRTGEQIMQLLHDRCRSHRTTLIIASHSGLTAKYADRVLWMVDGIVAEGHKAIETTP